LADLAQSQSGTIEERKDLGTGDAALYAYWMGQEKIAEQEEKKWRGQAKKIVKRYRDERSEANKGNNQFNILWSNVQTLLPTLYARTPKADVERRFRDEDPTGRLASTLLERSILYFADHFNFDDVMGSVTEDRLLPGRGTARVLYIPHFGDEIKDPTQASQDGAPSTPAIQPAAPQDSDEQANADEEADPLREVDYEEVKPAYVFWEDYREGPARKWSEVPWTRYASYETREALVKRFGKKKGSLVSLDYTPKGAPDGDKGGPADLLKKAVIFEFWDKVKREVVWLAPGTPDVILDKLADPLRLPGFFPSPNPCLATTTNDKRIPVPDYLEYQDQARELDNLTARIDNLTKALKVFGFYPGENKQVLQQVFDDGMENKLVPVEDWAFFTDGKPNGGIVWLPIQQVAEVLIQLYNARDRVKAILYEITGIGDIMRGMTSPDETLGAQELKANFSTRRITPQQKAIARFARDMFRLMGAVVAEHFSPKTITMVTGYPQLKPVPQLPQAPPQQIPAPMPQPQQGGPQPGGTPGQPGPPGQPQLPMAMPQVQMQPNPAFAQWQQQLQAVQAIVQENQRRQAEFDQAVQMLKQDGAHGFRIDIEADSTIAPDEQAEKASRTQFLQQFIPLMETVVPIAQGNPPLADLARELVMFGVQAFRVARPLEEAIEKAFDAIGKMPPNPKATGQDGKGAGPKGKSPVEIAADVHAQHVDAATTVQSSNDKLQAVRETNATKLMIANQQQQAEREKLVSEQPFKSAELALEGARIKNQNDAESLRAATIAQRGAGNLQ
jgi:hypothetical protein